MSSTVGWLLATSSLILWLAFSSASQFGIYLDIPSLLLLVPVVYGLSFVIHGTDLTVESVSGIKYLFVQKPPRNRHLALLYKNQIKFSMIAAVIGMISGLIPVLNYMDSFTSIGPALVIVLSPLVYSVVISGMVFYPLYKKLQAA